MNVKKEQFRDNKKKVQTAFILATFLFVTIFGSSIIFLAEYSPNQVHQGISSPYVGTGGNPNLYASESSNDWANIMEMGGLSYKYDQGQTTSVQLVPYSNGNHSPFGWWFWIWTPSGSQQTVWSNTASSSIYYNSPNIYASYTFSSKGTYQAQLAAEASDGTGYSSKVSITVYSDPTVSVSASSTSTDLGHSISLTASGSGGTGSYSYSWSSTSGSFSSTTVSNPTWTPSATGSVTLTLTFQDSAGYSITKDVTISVGSALSVSLEDSKNPSDLGQSVIFTANPSGGSGTYPTYNFYMDGSSVLSGSGSQLSYDFTNSGSYTIYVVVTDSNGITAQSGTITQTVNVDPSVSISSTQNPTDAGNTVEFLSSVSGGTPGYSYSWSINGNSYSTQDINVSFASSGTYVADLTVTDAAGYSVSKSYSETVNSAPTVSASSNVSSADVGYPIEFSSSPSGGVGPYTYSWVLNGQQVSTSQDFYHSFSSSGSYTATITITDSVGKTYSSSVTVNINANPSVSIISSQSPTDTGNSVVFKSSISGGTGSDTYLWTINGVQQSTASQFSYSFGKAGNYYVNLTVTDGDSHIGSASFVETVNPDPSVLIHAVHSPTDVGIWSNFTASITGGTPGYNYTWTVNSQTFSTSYVNYTFTAPGTFQITLVIVDSNGNKASASMQEVVNPLPEVSVQATYTTVDQGINDTFFADVTGGSSPFNYTWSLGSSILNYSQQFHLNFTSLGTYEINLTVRDSLGSTTSTSFEVKVIQKPSALIEGSNITDVGTTTYWEGYGSFGTEPYSYFWFINGVNTTSGLYLSYTFPKAGNYNITLIIQDSQGARAEAYLDISVVPTPKVSISLSKIVTDVGIPVRFNSSVSGGDPFFNYSWTVSGIGFVGYQQDMEYSFSQAGNYTVSVTVYDGSGNSATSSLNVRINNPPEALINATYSNIDPNVTDSFNPVITGGTPGFNYSWYIGSSLVGISGSLNYSFSAPGVYGLTLDVKDSQGETASYVTDITVSSYPEASIIYSGNSIDANVSETFRASSFGGIGPFSDQWIIGGQEYSSNTVSHSFTDPGNYTVQLIVSDSFGKDATSTLTVNVHGDPAVSVKQDGKAVVSQSFGLNATISGGIPAYEVQWIFPDGQQESGLNITHVFESSGPETYQVVVRDAGGFRGTYNFTVNVDLYVTVSDSTPSGLAPLQEQFFADVLGGSGYAYHWNFANGNTSVAQNPGETFSPGNYSVVLQVVASNGATGTANITVRSLPYPVSITYTPGTAITVLTTVHFKATPNWDSQGTDNGTWFFPNGQKLEVLNVSYKFPVYQEFNPVIFQFTYAGHEINTTLEVRMIPSKPVPVISSIPSVIPVGTILAVNGTGSYSYDSNIISYSWSFNGHTYSGQDQFFQFNRTGNYSITLTVEDALGASSTNTINVQALHTGTNSTITFSSSSTTSGPHVYYSITIHSQNGISAVEAFLGSQSLPLVLVSENGSTEEYNFTVNQQDYQPGTYGITVIAFNNQSQSNSTSLKFSVSSTFGKSGFNLVTALGGPMNFWLIILTAVGTIATVYGVTRHGEEVIDINGTKLEGKPGKPLKIVSRGKKR